MKMNERRVGDVTVVDVAGRLTLTDNLGRLKEKVTALVNAGQKQLVLNMADVTYVDSSGLGALVASYLRAKRNGGALKLANAGGRTYDLLVLTKLLTVFDTYDSEQAAIDSFDGVAV